MKKNKKSYQNTGRRLILALSLFFLVGAISCFAQTQISGVVSDEATGDPIPGVNVYLKGTSIGVTTNLDGFSSDKRRIFAG